MASKNTMLYGSPILLADNTIPGVRYTQELEKVIPEVIQACLDFGVDPYPPVVELLTYDDISEVAAYGGFPVRFPHWSFGMEYEELSRGYEHGMHKIYEMVINCLHPETPVLTQRGTVPARLVTADDHTYATGLRKVVAVIRQPKAKTVSISAKGLGRKVVCSPNHRWRVMTDQGPDWKPASELKADDLLMGSDTFAEFQGYPSTIKWTPDKVLEETRSNIRHRVKAINPPTTMTLALAELVGAIVGDGSNGVVSRENMVSVVVDKDEIEYIDHICSLFQQVFGIEPILEEKGSVTVVTLCSKSAVDYLDTIGHPKGVTYHTKRIPSSIWASSHEFRARFLRGFFDTDGSPFGVINSSAYNHELACDVQLLLLEMGIGSVVSRIPNGKNEISVVKVQGKANVCKFVNRIGFSLRYKADGLQQLMDVGPSTNRGLHVPFIRQQIVALAGELGITTYNSPSLGFSVNRMKHSDIGLNAMYGFLLRAAKSGLSEFESLMRLCEVPYFAIESVEEGEETETIDIALDGGNHDFLASGLLSHNTNPSYIYCLDSNPLLDHITVIAHATFHSDFFKNNAWFEPTTENAMNELANHGSRMRRYMDRWGREKVIQFIDWVLSIDDLIDLSSSWMNRQVRDIQIRDTREYHYPRRLKLPAESDGTPHDYMEDWINTPEWRENEKKRVERLEAMRELHIFDDKRKDILGFLVENAPLAPWQQDVISMLYREAQYFAPQGLTKMLNEGWASFGDYNIMARRHWAGGDGIYDYARHKMGVLGGRYSMNPYAIGFKLFLEIEERWNKGRFGREYEQCEDRLKRKNWDTKAGQGHEKVFEVRAVHNDLTAIHEFIDQDFIDKYEIYVWDKFPLPDGGWEYRIKTRDVKQIKQLLMSRYSNGGRPDIRLVDPNYANKGIFLMEHQWDNRILAPRYAQATLVNCWNVWNNGGVSGKRPVALSTRDKEGNEFLYVCTGQTNDFMSRKVFEDNYGANMPAKKVS